MALDVLVERNSRYGVKGFSSRFKAYLSINQLIPSPANVLIAFDTVVYDTLNEFDTTVGIHEFIPLHAGYYLLQYHLTWITTAPLTTILTDLDVNGGFGVRARHRYSTSVGNFYVQTDSVIEHLDAGDRVNMITSHNILAGLTLQSGLAVTYICGHRLS